VSAFIRPRWHYQVSTPASLPTQIDHAWPADRHQWYPFGTRGSSTAINRFGWTGYTCHQLQQGSDQQTTRISQYKPSDRGICPLICSRNAFNCLSPLGYGRRAAIRLAARLVNHQGIMMRVSPLCLHTTSELLFLTKPFLGQRVLYYGAQSSTIL